jgi:hypothetical protein
LESWQIFYATVAALPGNADWNARLLLMED